MSSGPVEQLSPTTSTSRAVQRRQHGLRCRCRGASCRPGAGARPRSGSAPSRPVALNASRAPKIAALTSRMSWAVSMMIRSAPPSTQAPRLLARRPRRAGGTRCRRASGRRRPAGSPVGPIEPATNRSVARGLARDLGRLAVDLERVLAEAPLLELQARALEGVGLDAPRRPLRPSTRGRPRSRRGGGGRAPRGTCPGGRRSPRSVRSNCSSVAPMPPSKTTTWSRTAPRKSRSLMRRRRTVRLGFSKRSTCLHRSPAVAPCPRITAARVAATSQGRAPRSLLMDSWTG